MGSKDQERIKRLLLAALLKSDFSVRELELLRSMISDPEFVYSITDLIDAVAYRLRTSAPTKSRMDDSSYDKRLVLDFVQKRRLSKRELATVFEAASKRFHVNSRALATKSTKELIGDFFESASAEEIMKLLERVGFGGYSDPYLRGISKRLGKKENDG